MNTTAQSLGVSNSFFANPHGLSNRMNRSTAQNVGKLASVLMQDAHLRHIVSQKEYTCFIQNPDYGFRFVRWRNTNKLLEKGFNGVKTGNTMNAGPCICASFLN